MTDRYDIALKKSPGPEIPTETPESAIIDAEGVTFANRLLSTDMDLVSFIYIAGVCKAVINRYNRSVESAELVTIASDILHNVSKGTIYPSFRTSAVKKLCLYLLRETQEEPLRRETQEEPLRREAHNYTWDISQGT